jgi:hypothetical protein
MIVLVGVLHFETLTDRCTMPIWACSDKFEKSLHSNDIARLQCILIFIQMIVCIFIYFLFDNI